jgi:nucleotide-binding universal stress UspA family protein
MKYTLESIRKILMPTNGSEYSLGVAQHGLSLAKQYNVQTTIMHLEDEAVIERFTHVNEHEEIEIEIKENWQNYVNFILSLAKKKCVKANSLIIKEHSFEQIVHLANGLKMDFIVMGTYEPGGIDASREVASPNASLNTHIAQCWQ